MGHPAGGEAVPRWGLEEVYLETMLGEGHLPGQITSR